jgi:MarR family transcriptional regulator, organic hydroperoxide resistance regulator
MSRRPATAPVEPVEERTTMSPASEAWILIHRIHWSEKPRFMAIGQEFELAPQQAMALRMLHEPRPMGELAKFLFCDNSNVTGIVDRLEERGLVERRPADHDRRVKLIELTEQGQRVRREIERRINEPPRAIADLPEADQIALRDILRRALDSGE